MAKLTAKTRNALKDSDFALPGRRYPIENESHARNALARASGKPEEAKVRAAVHRRFPGIGKDEKEPPGTTARNDEKEPRSMARGGTAMVGPQMGAPMGMPPALPMAPAPKKRKTKSALSARMAASMGPNAGGPRQRARMGGK